MTVLGYVIVHKETRELLDLSITPPRIYACPSKAGRYLSKKANEEFSCIDKADYEVVMVENRDG